ncbi:MAG: hypothetical protein ACKVIN_09800 [Longimicrobiales bacterium]
MPQVLAWLAVHYYLPLEVLGQIDEGHTEDLFMCGLERVARRNCFCAIRGFFIHAARGSHHEAKENYGVV